jgi:hypothetical protein
MGYGEYSHAAHAAITSARSSAPPVFATSRAHPLMSPHGVVRECLDSDDHPDSVAVLFALDVSGSMGDVPRTLATSTLPDFMRALLDAGVNDPQLCFMAVGHAGQDAAPLQVGQFESTAALIDQWLVRLWLEGGGVGRNEAYELAMYFAARHVRLDSVSRRGRRGFLFLTGDTGPNPAVSRAEVARLIGDALTDDIPIRALIDELQQSFEPFFLLSSSAAPSVERAWRDLLGDRVVRLAEAEDAAYVAAGLVALLEGATLTPGTPATLPTYINRLAAAGMPRRSAARVATSLAPFAASVGRDGAPAVGLLNLGLPKGSPPSGMVR